jgi:hypothetical protein
MSTRQAVPGRSSDVRFMMLVKSAEGGAPNPELMAAVGRHAQEMAQAGVLLDMGGLAPSARGARIKLSGGRMTVTDGPFTEAKELIGGYAVLRAASKGDAIALGRQFLQLHADILGPEHEIELEVRELSDPPDQG